MNTFRETTQHLFDFKFIITNCKWGLFLTPVLCFPLKFTSHSRISLLHTLSCLDHLFLFSLAMVDKASFFFSLNVRLCGAYLKTESSGLSSFPASDRQHSVLATILLPGPSFPLSYSVTSCQRKNHGIAPILLNSSNIMCMSPSFHVFFCLSTANFLEKVFSSLHFYIPQLFWKNSWKYLIRLWSLSTQLTTLFEWTLPQFLYYCVLRVFSQSFLLLFRCLLHSVWKSAIGSGIYIVIRWAYQFNNFESHSLYAYSYICFYSSDLCFWYLDLRNGRNNLLFVT